MQLDRLPVEVLELVLAHLSLKDRVAILSSSKALSVTGCSLKLLGEELDITVQEQHLTSFQLWLRNRRWPLGSLKLTASSSSPQASADLLQELLASSVHTLSVTWTGPYVLCSPAAVPAPSLQQLTVTVTGSIEIHSSLSRLASLTTLTLVQSQGSAVPYFTLQPGWLPRSLEALQFVKLCQCPFQPGGDFPEKLQHLGLLFEANYSLGLEAFPTLWRATTQTTSWLPRFGGLISLHLAGSHLEAVPDHLAVLTRLQRLTLRCGVELHGDPWMLPLLGMLQLTFLDLGWRGLERVPDGILRLPKLQVLRLDGNPQLDPIVLPFSRATAPITHLALDLLHVMGSYDELGPLRSLRRLEGFFISEFEYGMAVLRDTLDSLRQAWPGVEVDIVYDYW
ncbi:hypothetical protein N2152v2_009939 [Parachlorella kessleri]